MPVISKDRDELNRAPDEPGELEFFKARNVSDPFLKSRDGLLRNRAEDLIA